MRIETNLFKIRHAAIKREDENYRFRSFLKGKDPEWVDRIVHRLHEELTKKIDCRTCSNCCRAFAPLLSDEDIGVLAGMENITPEEYEEKYCEADMFGDACLNSKPCRYLGENQCSIPMDKRPEQCRDFPYTGKKGFTSRLLSIISFYGVCPIVYNLMEQLKKEVEFRGKRAT